MFELTLEALTAIPGLIYARLWVMRHDLLGHAQQEQDQEGHLSGDPRKTWGDIRPSIAGWSQPESF